MRHKKEILRTLKELRDREIGVSDAYEKIIGYMEESANQFKEGVNTIKQCCSPTNGFDLGTTCPKCRKPFRVIN